MTDQGPWHIPGSSDTTLSLSRHWHSFPVPAASGARCLVSGDWPSWSQWFNLPAVTRGSQLALLWMLMSVFRVRQRHAETRNTAEGPGLTHTTWHPMHEPGIHHETGPIWARCLSSRSRDCPSWRYRDKSHSVTEPVTSSLCPVRSGSDYGWDKLDPGTGNWLYWRFWHDMIYKYKHWASDDTKLRERESHHLARHNLVFLTINAFIHTFTRINVNISLYSIFSES